MRVLYISHLLEQSGWGQASRDILKAMDSVGIDVVPRVVYANNPSYKPQGRMLSLLQKNSKNCDVVIQHVLPHLFQYDGNFKRNIGLYYAESGELNYTSYFSYLNMMDELWVPSAMMIQQAVSAGVKTPIYQIPHPFNQIDVNKYNRLPIAECESGDYVFYYLGEATRRKNLSALIRAFHTEFSFNEPVQLVIKASKPGMSNSECANLINEIATAAKENSKLYYNVSKFKREIIINSDMSDDNIRELHKTCDCLVVPSSGEAINLPAMDALNFGNMVVGNKNTGIKEFVRHLGNGYLVKSHLKNCYGMVDGFKDMYSARETCYEIDEIDLCNGMRWAYNNRGKHTTTLSPTTEEVGLIIKERLYESSK